MDNLFVKTILLIFSLFRNLISRTEVYQNSISEKCILGAIIHQNNDIVFQKQVRSRTFIHQYMYTMHHLVKNVDKMFEYLPL